MSPESATLGAKRFSAKDLYVSDKIPGVLGSRPISKKIEKSEKEQKQLRQRVIQSKEFSDEEKAAFQYDTLADFRKHWVDAVDAKSSFDPSQDKVPSLWARKQQSFSSIAQSFMEDFSPIVQIIRDFGSPYGGLAVGTIALLFVVAYNKDKTEGSLAIAISGMNDRMPGLKMYKHIYTDDQELDVTLQAKIVSAYESFMEFAISATKYYKTGGPRRFLRALGGADTLRTQGDDIQAQFVDIRHLCEELLNKNVDTIKRLEMQQANDIKRLEAQIEQLQVTNDSIRLNEIQKLLKLDTFCEDQRVQELEKYHKLLIESLDTEQFEQMRDERLAAFERCPDYQTWLESSEACALILSGYNERSILDEPQCWLSPVALNHISKLSQQQRDQNQPGTENSTTEVANPILLAYQLLPEGRETLIHQVIPPILLQLLRQKSHALREDRAYAELCTDLRAYNGPPRESIDKKSEASGSSSDDLNENVRIAALEKIAARVVGFFDEGETVFVVVDRVDRCMDAKKDVDHRKALTKSLVRMVEGARCRLKVLAVINGYDWRIEERRDEFAGEKRERMIIHTERQCRLEVDG